jgi:thiol-disulfide isomerase/thioredoxin
LFYVSSIAFITDWIDYAYIYNNQLQNNREAIDKYYATRKFDLPDDFYNVFKDFPAINEPQVLYIQVGGDISRWQAKNLMPVFSKAFGTDQGTLFELMKTADVYNNINLKPVTEEQIEQLPVAYREFIRMIIEANKNKTGFTIHDVEQQADEDVFPFILSKFKGKPILLDFWETWCGPCRQANKELKPVKEELADKDIVYVYVASESSPSETWANMIIDLPGEHFRLSEKQRNYIANTFGSAVPTYFFIDRQGNIKDKQVGFPGVQQMKEKLLQLLE